MFYVKHNHLLDVGLRSVPQPPTAGTVVREAFILDVGPLVLTLSIHPPNVCLQRQGDIYLNLHPQDTTLLHHLVGLDFYALPYRVSYPPSILFIEHIQAKTINLNPTLHHTKINLFYTPV